MQKYLFFVICTVISKFRHPFPKDYRIENRKEIPILIIVTMSNVHTLWLVFIRDYDINKYIYEHNELYNQCSQYSVFMNSKRIYARQDDNYKYV